jgi:hypothetical protein
LWNVRYFALYIHHYIQPTQLPREIDVIAAVFYK